MRQQVTTNNLLYKKLSMLFIVFFMTVIVSAQISDTRTGPYTKGGYYKANGAFVFNCNADKKGNDKNQNFYVNFPNKARDFHHQVAFEVQRQGAVGTRHGMFTDWGHLYLVANWDNNVRTEDIIFGFGSNERSKIRERMRLTDSGNLGIGTSSPKKTLHVNGDTYSEGHVYYYAHEGDGKSGTAYIQARDESYRSSIALQFRTQERGAIRNALRINPNGTTEFNGTTTFKNDIVAFKDFTVGKNFNFTGNINFNDSQNTQQMNVTSGLQISLKNSNANNTFKIGSVAGANALYVANNGKIGMGTDTPSEKLQVDGKIKASGFVADASAFPDYVFANDYELTPLNEVKEFVTTNKHLPNMPSEKEVVANGLDLKQVITVSVEKIEELYLYTIKQQELIEKLTKRIEQLENNQK